MSRPPQVPPPVDHEHHDALLVSRLAAGDPLDQADYGLAMALVSGCAECASLAADLRMLATAVAWEPVPPRRRDFRLGPEQAEQARGSGFQRLMRRLALPQSNGLRPLAAGVMSLGLVLVVAGSFWPQDIFDDTVQQEVAAPSTTAAPKVDTTSATTPPGRADEQNPSLELEFAASFQAPLVDNGAGASADSRAQDADAASDDGTAAEPAADSALEAAAAEIALDTSLSRLESQDASGLTRELAAPESSAKVSSSPVVEAITEATEAAPHGSAAPAAQAPDVGFFSDATESLPGSDALAAAQAEPSGGMSTAAEGVVGTIGEASESTAANEAVTADGAPGDSPELAISQDDGISIETAVVTVGLGLVVAGLSLWLVVWIARRRDRDPLAR